MAELIRVLDDCDGLDAPHPAAVRLYRFGTGSELRLLRNDDKQYYKVAYEGRLLYVARAATQLVDTEAAEHAVLLTEVADTVEGALPLPGFIDSAAAGEGAVPPTTIATWMPGPPRPKVPAQDKPAGFWRRVARSFGVYLGLNLLIAGLATSISAAPHAISPGASVSDSYGTAIGGAILVAAGLGMVRLAYRPLLQFAIAIAGAVLIIGGIELLVFAIPLVRISRFDVDHDRVRTAFPIAAGAFVVSGAILLSFAIIRWWRNPESRKRWPEIARWGAMAYGALLFTLIAIIFVSTGFSKNDWSPTLLDAAAMGAAIPLALLPGALLFLSGLRRFDRVAGRPFRFPPATALLGVFAAAVALGAVVAHMHGGATWLLLPAHAAAGLVPALVAIALVSRGGPLSRPPIAGVSYRQLGLALALGVVVVTMCAGIIDGIIAEALSLGFLANSGAFDYVPRSELGYILRHSDLYLSHGQQIALLVIVVCVLAPIMEEGFKALGVATILPRYATPSSALLLGVAVGAGFGVFEGTAYGLGGLQPDSPVDWWAFMTVRAGATMMHALNTGILGLALYYGRADRLPRRSLLLYAAAVATHALWNLLCVLAGTRVIFSFDQLTDRQLATVSFAVLSPLALATISALYYLARRSYNASPKQQPALPLFDPGHAY